MVSFTQMKGGEMPMYNTEDEFDAELEALKEKIKQESENTSINTDENTPEEVQYESKLENRIKELFDDDKTEDEIVFAVAEALDTASKRFKAEYDVEKLLSEEEEIKEVYPEFDILKELKSNTLFKRLIANGVNVHKSLLASSMEYEDIITSIIKRDAKRDMAELLRKGKEKIPTGAGRMSYEAQLDVSKMSEEEFSAIEEKVKKNKRVFL